MISVHSPAYKHHSSTKKCSKLIAPVPWTESSEDESEAKRPRVSDAAPRRRECRRSIQSAGGLSWSSADLTLAATLLQTPNARFPSITFANAEEKRRVFTLVYDVLRYKSVLNQALNDLYFFTRYPELSEHCHLVWLLFFDLYKRDFTHRDPLEPEVEAAFTKQGLHYIDEVLWQLRVKLAATVSRLRIKSGAHSLSKLLPRHLRITRSALEENIITGWVNVFKTNVTDVMANLEMIGIGPLSRNRDMLEPLTFRTDHLLPRFLHMMPHMREELVETPLLRDYHIVMQERTFCLGPAIMAQLLKDYSLSGKVAQTHVNSPTTTAYFANLLINNDKIEALLVFGAGYRKEACEQYLRELGVKNTHVYSESFAGLSAESRVLDNVIAVLATPPNTNSSVVDPVDLAVTRGGDLQILQELTDDDFASTPRDEHINKFLVEQRDTLRRAMSKPQIQFVVYETHSRFHCENEEMATNLVNELNNYAAEVHLEELRKAQGETTERERVQAEPSGESQSEVPAIKVDEDTKEMSLSIPTPPAQSVVVPPSDLFELSELPDLCPNTENCLDLVSEGMYVAFIKRKEIIRLDPKYMIQMAEARGLFGRPEGTPKDKKSGQTARAKAALAALQARSEMMADKGKTKVKVEMERIAAPTRASLLRDVKPPSERECPRHVHHLAHDGTPSYLIYDPGKRKEFLTPDEEEALIRRLYLCPRVNVYPPTLYEDLPPLKFWDSPASVIQSYIQRKVFQRRLQLAYEFNQTKEPQVRLIAGDIVNKTPVQFTEAIKQLSEDISFFETIACHQSMQNLKDLTLETERLAQLPKDREETDEKLNKAYWDKIRPEPLLPFEVNYVKEEESTKQTYSDKLLLNQLKKRFFNYKDFYRLKNLRTSEEKPLAITIGLCKSESSAQLEESYESESSLFDSKEVKVTYQTENEERDITKHIEPLFQINASFVKDNEIKHQIENKAWCRRKHLLNALSENGESNKLTEPCRLPKLKYSSLDTLRENMFSDYSQPTEPTRERSISEKMSSLPQLSQTFEQANTERISTVKSSTLLDLRDSLIMARTRMSSKTNYSRKPTEQVSYLSLASQHKDSLPLTHNKWLDKVATKSEMDLHRISIPKRSVGEYSNEISPRQSHSILYGKSTLIDHHDSVILALERFTSKDKEENDLIECDICNNKRTSTVQFSCNAHKEWYAPEQHKRTILSMKKLILNHVDSIDLVKADNSKGMKIGVSCQADEADICKAMPLTTNVEPTYEKKGNQKGKKHIEQVSEKDVPHMSPSKLNNYLMAAIKINQVITGGNN